MDPTINEIKIIPLSFDKKSIIPDIQKLDGKHPDAYQYNDTTAASSPRDIFNNELKISRDKLKDHLSTIDSADIHRFNPFEKIGRGPFKTRAALKLANLDAIHSLVHPTNDPKERFTVCDIAGAPGAWTNYISSKCKNFYQVYGISLETDNKALVWDPDMVGTDGSFKAYTENKGDVIASVESFPIWVKKQERNGVDLCMADGGVDVEGEYALQEQKNIPVIYHECLLALLCLRTGGDFVCKVYDITTPLMRDLINLMSIAFDSIFITKPVMSRPASDERYFICKKMHSGGRYDFSVDQMRKGVKSVLSNISSKEILPDSAVPEKLVVWLREVNNMHMMNQIFSLNLVFEKKDESNRYHLRKALLLWQVVPSTGITTLEKLENEEPGIVKEVKEIAAEKKTRIIIRREMGGLLLDGKVIQERIPGSAIVLAGDIKEQQNSQDGDTNIFIEHFYKGFRGAKNYIVINHESIYQSDLDAIKERGLIPLAKTQIGMKTLRDLGIPDDRIVFTGFATLNYAPTTKVSGLFIHLAGSSPFKGTDTLLAAWIDLYNKGLITSSTLFISRIRGELGGDEIVAKLLEGQKPEFEFMGIKNLYKVGNIYITRNYLSEKDHSMLVSSAEYHIVPSIVEGYGHAINQGRAVGSVVITTDAPPMNEFVTEKNGILVKPQQEYPMKQVLKTTPFVKDEKYNPQIYLSSKEEVIKAIQQALSLDNIQKIKMGEQTQEIYTLEVSNFTKTIKSIFS